MGAKGEGLMATFISAACSYLVGGYNIGTATTQAKVTLSAEPLDITAFGQSAERVSTAGGLRKDSIDWAGFFADGSESPDAYLDGSLGTVGDVVSFAIGSALGDRAYCGTVLSEKVAVGGEVRGLVRYEATWRPDNTLDRCKHIGKVTTGSAGATATGTIDDSALSTGTGQFYSHIIVLGGTGTRDITLQHSSDGTTWTNKVQANYSGTGSKKSEFTGTLNRYIRMIVDYTVGTGGTVGWFAAYKRP